MTTNPNIKMPIAVLFLILASMIQFAVCEEWFFPDSRLISPDQFKEKVKNNNATYKVVKFFTPNCQWCRHLKTVIDKVKHEKEWSFEIYDLHCGWYGGWCMQEAKATSFPFTGVYDR